MLQEKKKKRFGQVIHYNLFILIIRQQYLEPISNDYPATFGEFIQPSFDDINGVSIYDNGTGFGGSLSVNIEKDGQFATAYDYTTSRQLDLEYEQLTDDVCELAQDSLNPKAIETKDCDVILDYYAASGLLSTFIQGFNSENVLRGRSILHDKIGSQITSENLSIIDNPLLEGAMGTCKADGEGTASKKTVLVEDGILKSFIYDIYTSNKADCESTSNGYRGSYLTTPDVSPSNLEFQFKTNVGIDEIDSGIITTSVLGAHTANPISGDFSVEANNAFVIENGEIKELVEKNHQVEVLKDKANQLQMDVNDCDWYIRFYDEFHESVGAFE